MERAGHASRDAKPWLSSLCCTAETWREQAGAGVALGTCEHEGHGIRCNKTVHGSGQHCGASPAWCLREREPAAALLSARAPAMRSLGAAATHLRHQAGGGVAHAVLFHQLQRLGVVRGLARVAPRGVQAAAEGARIKLGRPRALRPVRCALQNLLGGRGSQRQPQAAGLARRRHRAARCSTAAAAACGGSRAGGPLRGAHGGLHSRLASWRDQESNQEAAFVLRSGCAGQAGGQRPPVVQSEIDLQANRARLASSTRFLLVWHSTAWASSRRTAFRLRLT